MKRLLLLVLSLICLSAGATHINRIDTRVYLVRNGNAVIGQTWDIDIDSGTEWYIPISNLGKCYVRDFDVVENDIKYENDGRSWNSNRSLAEKTRRCGIVEKSGGDIELCWGQGEFGHHVYNISYVVENMVQSMDEGDGFHWHFLNDEWSAPPDSVNLVILNRCGDDAPKWYWNDPEDKNVRFWAFGFTGDTAIEDGKITMHSTEPFRYQNFLSVLVLFDKGLFSPKVEANETFAELKDAAFKGSDFKNDDTAEKVGEVVGYIAVIGLLIWIFKGWILAIWGFFVGLFRHFTGMRYAKWVFGKTKIDGWSREVPLGGSPVAIYSLLFYGDELAKTFDLFENMIGAYFLKWIMEGRVKVARDKTSGKRMEIYFDANRTTEDIPKGVERSIYYAAFQASGDNHILEANEFKKWSSNHDIEVYSWKEKGWDEGKAIWQAVSKEKRCELITFKNYLEDFTLSSEREAPEVGIWKQYLIVAQSLGIAYKVVKNFEKLYPQLIEKYSAETQISDSAFAGELFTSISMTSSALVGAAISAKASRDYASSYTGSRESRSYHGGGGRSSSSGGGGGYGGGHGGGSR